MWIPELAWQIFDTFGLSSFLIESLNGPVAFTTLLALMSNSCPDTKSLTCTPHTTSFSPLSSVVTQKRVCVLMIMRNFSSFNRLTARALRSSLSINALWACVYIFTSGSSALSGRPRCGLSIWLPLLAIYSTIHFSEFMPICFMRKWTNMRTLEVRHFHKIQKWLPMVTRCAKHFNIKILRASSQIPFDRYALHCFDPTFCCK